MSKIMGSENTVMISIISNLKKNMIIEVGFQKVFIKNQQNFLSAVQNLVRLKIMLWNNSKRKKAVTLKIRKFLWSICFETIFGIFLNTRNSPVNNSVKKRKKENPCIYFDLFVRESCILNGIIGMTLIARNFSSFHFTLKIKKINLTWLYVKTFSGQNLSKNSKSLKFVLCSGYSVFIYIWLIWHLGFTPSKQLWE